MAGRCSADAGRPLEKDGYYTGSYFAVAAIPVSDVMTIQRGTTAITAA
jgi:hypothetical protein